MIQDNIAQIRATLPENVTLVCTSKMHPIEAIRQAYEAGERDFGESRVQELVEKQQQLPDDIRWHFIGHLQTNKIRQILPFVSLIHSVDSLHLLEAISDEAVKQGRVVNVLIEMHVAAEETKTGFDISDADALQAIVDLNHAPAFLREYPGVNIVGLMGMATHTDDLDRVRRDFAALSALHKQIFPSGGILSMGMSEDFPLAIAEGANMIRIGSLIFGQRQ
ncbi:MAG: YggS family pyridoxal phosphate-dependent enzyme [Paludibacteraceae bacterium]|nr:YggS family pyridoxal phosphate-dependent enzyme [Paludibacteraceae bacterium]